MKYLNRNKPKKYQNAGLVKKVIGTNLYMVDQENLQIFDVNGQQLDAQDFPDLFPQTQTQSKKFDPLQEILNRDQNKKATINSLATVEKSERDRRIQERKLAKDAYNNDGYFQLPTGETKRYSDMDWREKSYVAGKSLDNKMRLFPNSESIIDDLNPLSLATMIGTAPLESKMSNSVLPYLTSVGTGLATGALAGIGAKNTGQFVNNLTNPIGTLDDIKDIYSTIKNNKIIKSEPLTKEEQELLKTTRLLGSIINSGNVDQSIDILESVKKTASGLDDKYFERLTGFKKNDIDSKIESLKNKNTSKKIINDEDIDIEQMIYVDQELPSYLRNNRIREALNINNITNSVPDLTPEMYIRNYPRYREINNIDLENIIQNQNYNIEEINNLSRPNRFRTNDISFNNDDKSLLSKLRDKIDRT